MNPFGDPAWNQGMLSPYYNDSHIKLRDMVRQLVETDLIPNVHDWDEAGEIPPEFRIRAYSTGMAVLACGHPFPTEYGPALPEFFKNIKLDEFHAVVVFQEIARAGSIGVGWGIGAGLCIGLPPVLHHGSDYLKQKVAPAVLRGEKVICLAVTEPNAGSDVSNVQTSAIKSDCGKFYLVNGVKKWITNGIFADYMTVLVRTKQGAGAKGLSMLLIETDSPGVARQKMKCSGVWCSGTTLITLDNVKVPVEHLIGKENKGFKYCVSNFNHERLIICAQAVASARVCYEEAWKHAHRRKTFGKHLVEHQVIRNKLGEMARQVEACQAWLENLAFQIETMHPREATMKLSGPAALLKVQCTTTLDFCARESSQVFGGLSFSRGGLGEMVERLSREVKSLGIPGGSAEIMIDLGVKMTSKLSQLGQAFIKSSGMVKQLNMAKRVGVNVDLYGEGNPFGDPSWYLTFNSAFYNESHRKLRNWIRSLIESEELDLLKKVNAMDEAMAISQLVRNRLFQKGLGFLAAGPPYSNANTCIEPLVGIQVDMFHELIVLDELSRVGSGGLVAAIWSSVADPIALLRECRPNPALVRLVAQVCLGEVVCAVACGDLKVSDSGQPRLTGQLAQVQNGCPATVFLVTNNEDDSLYMIERKNGVDVIPLKTSGLWAANLATITFRDTPAYLVRAKDSAHLALVRSLWIASVEALRFARVCYEEGLKHSPDARWKLGEMARQIEAGFCWLEQLTYHMNSNPGHSNLISAHLALVRLNATRVYEHCARDASQIVGVNSTIRGTPVERLGREVRFLALANGSEDALLEMAVHAAQSIKKHGEKGDLASVARL